jgi:hypothetical protein
MATFAGNIEGGQPIMVCTDLAARGLDFPGQVEHVVNFDFPYSPVDYLHRCAPACLPACLHARLPASTPSGAGACSAASLAPAGARLPPLKDQTCRRTPGLAVPPAALTPPRRLPACLPLGRGARRARGARAR